MRIAPRERLLLVVFGLLSGLGGVLVLLQADALPASLSWFTGLLLVVTGIMVIWAAFLPNTTKPPPVQTLLASERLSLVPLVLVCVAVLWTGLSNDSVPFVLQIPFGLIAGLVIVVFAASVITGSRLLPDPLGLDEDAPGRISAPLAPLPDGFVATDHHDDPSATYVEGDLS
jgi:hypothetical protein